MATHGPIGERVFASRTVRIFISSTFRDFAGERDLLVRKVFPELRRRCRERQVELVDVDLRWGITEAEAEQGKVLPICLAEIDRARPFFMGLLGERYGWVPTAGQFDRSLLIEQPWLDEHRGGKSVTELEILHGVLNNPEMAGRAFFYFRDPAWSVQQGTEYRTESDAERQKLAALKDRIRTSGYPVEEDYASPEALAERVREDLWTLIDAAYPEADVPDPLTLERRRHEAYGGSRKRLYLGGERYFEAIDTELAAESPRPVLVRGRSGGGKSALAANWLARWSQAHPNTAVIVHHLGCGADTADPVRMAVRIMQEIALLVGEEFKPTSDPDEQLDELAKWLATASAWAGRTGRTVLILMDGLDKLADRRHLRWFPTVLPPGVRLIASCLDGEVLEAASPRLPWRELVVEPFTAAEQTRFIGEYLGRFRKQIAPGQTLMLQAHPLVGNPLFLLTVLEELRVFGVHEQLDRRLAALLSPPPSKQPGEEPTVDDAFEHVLARIEADHGAEPVQRVMEAIWASRAGLYTDEILAIADVPPANWAGISNAVDESLCESSGRIMFGHDYLRKAVEDRYAITGNTRLTLHRRLAEYFTSRELDARVAEELPWQWREAQSRQHLRECLTNLEMFTILGSRDQYELLSFWVWIGDDIDTAYARALDQHSQDAGLEGGYAARVTEFLNTAGCYSDIAVSLLLKVKQHAEQWLGVNHADSLSVATSLAMLFENRGEYASAKPLYYRALEGRERALGCDDPDTLWSVNNLGGLLYRQGDYASAEPLYRRAVEGWEQLFGSDHPHTLSSINNLALLLKKRGDYTAAASLYRRVVNGFEKAFGPDHPRTLAGITNLANLLHAQGDYAASTQLYQQALSGFEKTLGPDHPDTLTSVSNSAIIFYSQGDYKDAEQVVRRVLEGREKALGLDHPDTLGTIDGLATILKAQSHLSAAEELYRRALEGRENALGSDHPDTLSSINNLGALLCEQGNYAAAEPLCRRALSGREKTLGPHHPDTLASGGFLASLLRKQGNCVAAERLCRQTLQGREQALGPNHPETLSSVNNLANVLGDQGHDAAATLLHRRALEGRERVLGSDHPDTLQSVHNYASVILGQGNFEAAEPLFRHAHEGRRISLGDDHPDTLGSAHNHAECVDALTPLPGILSLPDPPGTVINSIDMKLVTIPAGEFLMGSAEDCPFGDPVEEFQHRVRITRPFLLGLHQVTQSQYERVTGGNPSFFKGPDLPVEHLTWNDAQRFCELLSDLPEERASGRHYRLPTEAEWEYACRAGTTTTFNTGDTLKLEQARFATMERSCPKPTAPVGSYPPNAWGLFDMNGNVWEWTSDWFSADYFRESPIDDPQGPATGTHHTLRGGSASVEVHECRSAIRGEAHAVDGPETDTGNRYPLYGDFGIRVVAALAR
jgi:nephrocystin-3